MLKTLKMFKPTIEANKHKKSPRSCLLLKTLLVILCIYIKRVTSTTPDYQTVSESASAESLEQLFHSSKGLGLLYGDIYGIEGDLEYNFQCPFKKEAVIVKEKFKNNRYAATVKRLIDHVAENVAITWIKDPSDELNRPSGEMYFTDTKGHVTFMKLSLSDAGFFTCFINYSLVDDEARTYLYLYPGVTLNLIVSQKRDLLPDITPRITHPPSDLFVVKGDNATFTCKNINTLSHSTISWFVNTCAKNDTKCDEGFFKAYNETEKWKNSAYLYKYIIEGFHEDELQIINVSEANVGYYGCVVQNSLGVDIRRGRLQLLAVHPESTTIAPTTTPSVTTIASIITNTMAPNKSNHSIAINSSTTESVPILGVSAIQEQQPKFHAIYLTIGLAIITVTLITLFILTRLSRFIRKDKKNFGGLLVPEPVVGVTCSAKLRQHLPNGECPDIYNIGKSADGFISGHLLQSNGHLMSQSICSRTLDKEKNPSISSNSNSDEASSWGKPGSYHGDNSRTLYLHTSNTTTTTVPLYDHPPPTGTLRHCGTLVQDACVINPTYGLLRPECDATDWTFPRRNLQRLNKIGEGEFGEVWRFRARQKDGNENYVAVKQLKERVGLGDRERLELIAEIEIMQLVNDHPNVIKILHYCADDHEPLLLIMEYAEHGKLQTYLRNCRSFRKSFSCLNDFRSIITSKELIKFSYHIAKGMEYVASKGIVHRDLASRNILVSRDKVCKVADFGFGRRVNDEGAYIGTTDYPVPVKWMAPEALLDNKFTSKSDVFALGILMWEIVTLGATPYEYLTSTEVYKKVTTGGRLEKPLHCKDEFYQIMASCWEHDPAKRPTFKELAGELEKLVLNKYDYIELDQYPEHAYYNILDIAEKEKIVHIES